MLESKRQLLLQDVHHSSLVRPASIPTHSSIRLSLSGTPSRRLHDSFQWFSFAPIYNNNSTVSNNSQLYYEAEGSDYPLCRLYHGRGPPPSAGPRRSAAKFLPRCFDVWTFRVRLNVTTTKKVVNFLGKSAQSAPPQIRKSGLRVRKNGPRLTLVRGPRMVNPALWSCPSAVKP